MGDIPMSARRAIMLASTILLTLAAYAARPQAKDAAKTPSRPQSEKANQRVLTIEHQGWEYNETDETSDFKKAVITDEDTVFRADTVRVKNKKGIQTADATGDLLVTDPQVDVTGEKAVIYYAKSKRLAVLTGNIHITVKPKKETGPPPASASPAPAPVAVQNGKATVGTPQEEDANSASSARKHPAEITCDKLEYEYAKDKKHATLTGHFKVVQKLSDRTRTLTADHAEWFGTEERILLYAPVHWEDTKGMKGDTPKDVTIYTREGSEKLEMKQGTMTMPVEEEEEQKPAPPPAAPQKKP
jgi:lipopolysaccharide export system protein LptA